MRRVGRLLEPIASLDNLYLAFKKASKGKQRKKEVQDFCTLFDQNIAQLREGILMCNIPVGNYHYFTIHDPKERIICAASFSERILHHAIMNVCHPFFDRRLIDHTFATRPNKGIYQALDHAVKAASCCKYLVKLDFRKYFDSICHDKLIALLENLFKDQDLLRLFGRIIGSYCATEGRGLPIGNLTSQYFANAYLSHLDHWAKEVLRIKYYIRYMDDILIAGNDKYTLKQYVHLFSKKASSEWGLTLKPPVFCASKAGVVFLGYRILPYHYQLSGRSKRRYRSRLILYEKLLRDGVWDESEYSCHILPLLSFVGHARSKNFRRSCLELI